MEEETLEEVEERRLVDEEQSGNDFDEREEENDGEREEEVEQRRLIDEEQNGNDFDEREEENDGEREEEEEEDDGNEMVKSVKRFTKKHSFFFYLGTSVIVMTFFIGMTILGVILTFVFGKIPSSDDITPEPPDPNHCVKEVAVYRLIYLQNDTSMIHGYLELVRNETGYNNFEYLSFEIYQFESMIRFRTFPVKREEDNDFVFEKIERWEVPITLSFPPLLNENQIGTSYKVRFTEEPFSVEIISLDASKVEKSTLFHFYDLQFANQYLSIKVKLQSENEKLFGFSTRDFYLNPSTLSSTEERTCYYLWNKDEYLRYNFHPFTLFVNYSTTPVGGDHQQQGGNDFQSSQRGLLILTSNLIELCHDTINNEGEEDCERSSDNYVEYNTIGGIWDIIAFIGGSEEEESHSPVHEFQKLLGPKDKSVPPLWSLGFHQSRWGYNNISVLKSVVEEYQRREIPLDAIWSDIDYMEDYKDFTFDPVAFPIPQMQEFSNYLHSEEISKKYVVIIDPGIKTLDTYYPYIFGKEKDIFIRRNPGDLGDDVNLAPKYTTGIVWPGYTVFPDFSNPRIKDEYWKPLLQSFLRDQGIQIDGLWIDMNEIASFLTEEGIPESDKLNNPPYLPSKFPDGEKIYTKTISMDSVQYLGLTYDLHNMYGYQESIVTQKSFEELMRKRSFVLTRSTFLGSGNYVSNWLGDNFATYEDLQTSISGIFAQNMFGIQHVGADICGFNYIVDSELCLRWYALGSLYPFARQHSNKYNSNLKEPYRFGEDSTLKIKKLIEYRYSLLPYFYSLFHRYREDSYGMIWSPLFLSFPFDEGSLTIEDSFLNQIMLGKCVMIAPVLEPGVESIDVYFPSGVTFFDFYTFKRMDNMLDRRKRSLSSSSLGDYNSNQFASVSSPIGTIPLFYKEGCIVPRQVSGLSTEHQKSKPYFLHISVSSSEDIFIDDAKSIGELFIDEGDEIIGESYDSRTHFSFVFDPLTLILNGEMEENGYQDQISSQLIHIHQVVLMGYRFITPDVILVNFETEHTDFSFDRDDEILFVNNLSLFLNESFSLEF